MVKARSEYYHIGLNTNQFYAIVNMNMTRRKLINLSVQKIQMQSNIGTC